MRTRKSGAQSPISLFFLAGRTKTHVRHLVLNEPSLREIPNRGQLAVPRTLILERLRIRFSLAFDLDLEALSCLPLHRRNVEFAHPRGFWVCVLSFRNCGRKYLLELVEQLRLAKNFPVFHLD